jgi:colicin import membrane protein
MDSLAPAAADYEIYLKLEPDSPQRPEIERMIRLIRDIVTDRETKRIAEEERKKAEEEKRIAEEKRLKQEETDRRVLEEKQRREAEEARRIAEAKKKEEEAARQKALLESVLNSLKVSTEGTTNLSAEKEDIREKREEVDIED